MTFKKYKCIPLIVMIAITLIGHSQDKTINEVDLSRWFLRSQGAKLNADTGLTLGVYEYQFIGTTILEVPLLFKIEIIEDLSVLGGVTFDFYRINGELSSRFDAAATFGIQYDVNDDTYIQGLFNYQIQSTNNPYNFKTGSPGSFSVRSGFKF